MRKLIIIVVLLILIGCSVTIVIGTANRVDVVADKELDTGLDIDISKSKDTIK